MTFPLRRGALAALLVVALVPVTFAAEQTNGFHGSVSVLYVSPTDSDLSINGRNAGSVSLGGDVGVLAALGYGADVGLRGEIEFGYRSTDFEDANGDATTVSLMANGIYTFDAGKIRPYVGAGLGLTRHDAEISMRTISGSVSGSASDNVIAFQGIFGVSFPLSKKSEARLGYRYFATGDSDLDGLEASYGAHNIEAGVVFRF